MSEMKGLAVMLNPFSFHVIYTTPHYTPQPGIISAVSAFLETSNNYQSMSEALSQ